MPIATVVLTHYYFALSALSNRFLYLSWGGAPGCHIFAPLALRSISHRWRSDPFRTVGAPIHFAPLALRSISHRRVLRFTSKHGPPRAPRAAHLRLTFASCTR